jgi:hypothetical protein
MINTECRNVYEGPLQKEKGANVISISTLPKPTIIYGKIYTVPGNVPYHYTSANVGGDAVPLQRAIIAEKSKYNNQSLCQSQLQRQELKVGQTAPRAWCFP